MPSNRFWIVLLFLLSAAVVVTATEHDKDDEKDKRPTAVKPVQKIQAAPVVPAPFITLPTGWKITPAGRQVNVGIFPFDAVVVGNSTVTINSGWSSGQQSLSVFDSDSSGDARAVAIQNVFPGGAASPNGALFISGGKSAEVYRIDASGQIQTTYKTPGFTSGLAAIDDRYFVAGYSEAPSINGLLRPGHVIKIDTATGSMVGDTRIGDREPYNLAVAAGKIYATIPAVNQVIVLDNDLNVVGNINVGAVPQSMCQDSSQLYVVNSNSDEVSVINTSTDTVVQTIPVRFYNQEWGAALTSCAVDDTSLYVTMAQVNAVAIIDRPSGVVRGYIPTAWYPTKVLLAGDTLQVVSAKGVQPLRPNNNGQYVLSLLKGTLGIIDKSDIEPNLSRWTLQVMLSAPFLPFTSAASDQIKHIFYIIKENRTYDQVLGDLGKGNGDSNLTLFGKNVTPVQHYLADEFVTLDNLYVNGEAGTTGHSYAASGYASPYLQMMTGLDGSNRLDVDSSFLPAGFSPGFLWESMSEKGITHRVYGEALYLQSLYRIVVKHFGPQSEPASRLKPIASPGDPGRDVMTQISQLFAGRVDSASNQGELQKLLTDPSFGRSFSQAVCQDDSLYDAMQSNTGFLQDVIAWLLHLQVDYPTFNLAVSDLDRVESWVNDFRRKDALGLVEQFHYIELPNDHTSGSDSGHPTPTQYVAQNDAALDIILRAIAKSRVWSSSLVLIVEDDAQDGSDHVDATRTTAYAVGPWVKRKSVVSDRYDQVSMVRTVTMLLGLDPLSLESSLATPMLGIFTLFPSGDYNPPPVSSLLLPDDKTKYDALRKVVDQ